MPELKLPKLPDRAPVKMTILLQPDLSRQLHAYAEFYEEIYGETESLPNLIPFMLRAFIVSDREFMKRSKN